MKSRYGLEEFYHRKRIFVLRILVVFISLAFITFLVLFSVKKIRNSYFKDGTVSDLYSNWNLHSREGYEAVYQISSGILQDNHFHNAALTFKGYSAFMLAESETDNTRSQELLDEAVFSLRSALYNCREETRPQIEYMLARAYFYKNKISSYHYYSDMVVKYLEDAVRRGYKADDIPLLLGLSHADLGETDKSIAAFTEALLDRETDTLLFNIAKQYYNNRQESVAKQYLVRVLDMSQDENLLNSSHILLGQIYINEQKYNEAEEEFKSILEKNENSADAHYGLGVLYDTLGDNVKARSEWRKCLKIQFNHSGALKKMSEGK